MNISVGVCKGAMHRAFALEAPFEKAISVYKEVELTGSLEEVYG